MGNYLHSPLIRDVFRVVYCRVSLILAEQKGSFAAAGRRIGAFFIALGIIVDLP
jgi:hypothetical protein